MPRPRITQSPSALLVSVEDADLAIYGASRAAVTVSVECDSLNEIFVAMLEIEIE